MRPSPPLRIAERWHISPVPLDGVATDPVLRLGAVRRGANQKPRPSRVRSGASFGLRTDAVTQRVTAATARPERSARFGRAKTLQKARLTQSAGRAKKRSRCGTARDGNNPPAFQDGAVPQTGITQLQVERSLRGKRSDPSHGANAPPKVVAVPVVKVPVRTVFLQASQHPSGERTTGRWSPNRA